MKVTYRNSGMSHEHAQPCTIAGYFYYRQTLCNVDDYKYFSGAVSESDAI